VAASACGPAAVAQHRTSAKGYQRGRRRRHQWPSPKTSIAQLGYWSGEECTGVRWERAAACAKSTRQPKCTAREDVDVQNIGDDSGTDSGGADQHGRPYSRTAVVRRKRMIRGSCSRRDCHRPSAGIDGVLACAGRGRRGAVSGGQQEEAAADGGCTRATKRLTVATRVAVAENVDREQEVVLEQGGSLRREAAVYAATSVPRWCAVGTSADAMGE